MLLPPKCNHVYVINNKVAIKINIHVLNMFKKNAWADICTINGQTVQEDDIKAQSKKILKEMPISNKAAHKFPILNSNEGTGQPRSNH